MTETEEIKEKITREYFFPRPNFQNKLGLKGVVVAITNRLDGILILTEEKI
jgi:hypothetical protein